MEKGEILFYIFHFLIVAFFAFFVGVGIALLPMENQKCPETNLDCEWNLCRMQGSMEVCFGLPTNCTVLEAKCTYNEYMMQWNLNCTWLNNTCSCFLKDETEFD